ncbi:hypothetical protein MY10362_002587 [Beauveria mimosiformis]
MANLDLASLIAGTLSWVSRGRSEHVFRSSSSSSSSSTASYGLLSDGIGTPSGITPHAGPDSGCKYGLQKESNTPEPRERVYGYEGGQQHACYRMLVTAMSALVRKLQGAVGWR